MVARSWSNRSDRSARSSIKNYDKSDRWEAHHCHALMGDFMGRTFDGQKFSVNYLLQSLKKTVFFYVIKNNFKKKTTDNCNYLSFVEPTSSLFQHSRPNRTLSNCRTLPLISVYYASSSTSGLHEPGGGRCRKGPFVFFFSIFKY